MHLCLLKYPSIFPYLSNNNSCKSNIIIYIKCNYGIKVKIINYYDLPKRDFFFFLCGENGLPFLNY